MKNLLAISTLSLALMTGAAFAQNSGGAAAGGAAGGSATGGVSTETGNTGPSGTATTGATTGSSTVGGANSTGTNTGVTGSATSGGMGTGLSASINGMGTAGAGFFTDSSMSRVNTQERVTATYNALTPEQQQQLRRDCATGMAPTSGAGAELCTMVNRM